MIRGMWLVLALLFWIPPGFAGEGSEASPPATSLASTPSLPSSTRDSDPIAVVFIPRHTAILAAEVASRIVAIQKEFGEAFEKGELLVALADSEYRRQKIRAEAMLQVAQAKLESLETLFRDKSIPLREVEAARRDKIFAQMELEDATEDLASCEIHAPFAGRVVRVLSQEHELVNRGTALLEIIDDSVLLGQFLLPSKLFQKIHIGQRVTITVIETQTRVQGKIRHMSATMDPASRTFEVRAEIENPDRTLRAGMNGIVTLGDIEMEE